MQVSVKFQHICMHVDKLVHASSCVPLFVVVPLDGYWTMDGCVGMYVEMHLACTCCGDGRRMKGRVVTSAFCLRRALRWLLDPGLTGASE